MKRIFAMILCVSLFLTGCFGGNSDQPKGENPDLSDLFGGIRDDKPVAEGPRETVPDIPAHIKEWTDPLEGIPEPTYYTVDEELAWAMALIGMELIPPEDTLDEDAVMPMDGLWNTERTNTYQGPDSLTAENLQDFFAMYAKDADLTAPPPIMEPTPEPFYTVEAEVLKNFLDYYNEQSVMVAVFENFVEKHLEAYNEDKDYHDSVFLYLIAFQSMELAMGSSFTEEDDWAMLQRGMVMAAEMFGGTNAAVTRNAAHNYTITYNDSGAQVVDHFRADLGGGIQMLCYIDGELTEIFEFKELGNDTYAWQNNRERMVMTFKDKTVLSCWYSGLSDKAARYGEADLIFGSDIIPNQNWVAQREDFRNHIRFDGTLLEVYASNSGWGFAEHAQIAIGEI